MTSHLLFLLCIVGCSAFAPAPLRSSRITQSLAASNNNKNKKIADYEYQEMSAVLDAMDRQNIPSRYLQAEKRDEVEGFVRKVAKERPTAIPLKRVKEVLPGSEWKLGFSTESATLGDLPKDAQVRLNFLDDERVDYVLDFSEKTFGLNRLMAKSTYTVDSSDLNPGLVTFVYGDIVTDVFGMKNLGVGFFGLLKGRSNYIETVFMDNRFWIERGYTPEGKEFFNVYVRKLESSAKQNAAAPTAPVAPTSPGGGDQWD
jgi:hypothetical protein